MRTLFLPVTLLAPPADAQQPSTHHRRRRTAFWTTLIVFLFTAGAVSAQPFVCAAVQSPLGPQSVEEYQRVEAPQAAEPVRIDVLGLNARTTAAQAALRRSPRPGTATASVSVEHAASYFEEAQTGIEPRLVAVEPAPSAITAEAARITNVASASTFLRAEVVGGGDTDHSDRLSSGAMPATLPADGQSLRDRCSELAARPDQIRVNPPAMTTVTVDVLIVFSESRSRDRPEYSAENSIRLANCMYEVSRAPVRLRLAGWRVARGETAAIMAGFEDGSLGDSDRQRLLEVMAREAAHDRDALEADVVVGVAIQHSGPESKGWAWSFAGGRARAMAAVLDKRGSESADRDWRGTARVIAHEIGHLFGLGHGDRDRCAGAHMSYACAVDGPPTSIMSAEGFRNWFVPLFSTTGEVDWDSQWQPPGDARHDNVRAMRETAHVVASYRGRSWSRVPEPGPEPEPEPEPTPDPCRPGRTCLGNGFAVRVTFTVDGRTIGTGELSTHLGDDSAAFWFFDQNNAEVLLKVLNGCAVNGHWWVYAAPATDVPYWVSVWPPTDIVTPSGAAYKGYQPRPASMAHETDSELTWVAAITDTEAFRCRQ